MADFKTRFNLLKTEKDVTLQEIAENTNTTASSLSKVVNNKLSLKHDLINDLAKYFNVTKSYLLGESNISKYELDLDEEYIQVCELAQKMNISPQDIKNFLNLVGDILKR